MSTHAQRRCRRTLNADSNTHLATVSKAEEQRERFEAPAHYSSMGLSTGDHEEADEEWADESTASNDQAMMSATTDDDFDPEILDSGRNRRRAILYSMPFLALGVGNVILILWWGLEPLWAFALLPPILFTTFLTYLVFSTDFLEGR